MKSYYVPAQNLAGNALKVSLNEIIRGHTRFKYTPCVWEILKEADQAPFDETSVVGFYTRRHISKDKRDRGQNDPNSWNREHIWAKSHGFKQRSRHAFTDAHHIRAADRSVNSDRSDHDFDEGGAPDDECSGCFEGQGTWEPPGEVKGDVARMMFYMDVRYEGNDSSGTPNLQLVDRVNTERSETFGEFGKLCTLFKWHREDKVSAAERTRNTVIYSWQGNRNPFIDHPEFVAKIWGTQCSHIEVPEDGGKDEESVPDRPELLRQLEKIENEVNQLRQLIQE